MDAEEARTIGRRVRQVRHARQRSQRVVAGRAGISKSYLCRLEKGQRRRRASRRAGSAPARHPPGSAPGRCPVSGSHYPATPLLRRLTVGNGWRYDVLCDAHGRLEAVTTVRVGPVWTDSVAIAGEDH